MSFTELYCNAASGSNTNGGSGGTPITSTNGDWGNTLANRFVAASGTPFSSVTVGQYAALYLDGAAVAASIHQVTAVNGGGASIDLSSSITGGTAPATGATGRSVTVGGDWKGPNGTDGFPFSLTQIGSLVASGDTIPRINMKNGTDYAITANIASVSSTNRCRFQGYTTTPGDGGRARIAGPSTGASFILLTNSQNHQYVDLEFDSNGATGSANLMSIVGRFLRCVARNSRGSGFAFAGGAFSCEAYSNNLSNTSGKAGFEASGGAITCVNCRSHYNLGSNSHGFYFNAQGGTCVRCIAAENGSVGFLGRGNAGSWVYYNCDAYHNGASGWDLSSGASTYLGWLFNCISAKNGASTTGYGYLLAGPTVSEYFLFNNAYGTGTYANASGVIGGTVDYWEEGTPTIAITGNPYVDPDNGDFQINNAGAKSAAYQSFLTTRAAYNNTLSYMDLGAAQHQDSGGGGGGSIRTHQGMVGGLLG